MMWGRALCCAIVFASGVALAQPAPPKRNQPPEVKLKLGHYHNAKRGIGVVVDLTRHEGRVRFDGAKETLHLDPRPSRDRVDYVRTGVVLEAWNDGHMVVYIRGAREGIEVERDGDADPLE